MKNAMRRQSVALWGLLLTLSTAWTCPVRAEEDAVPTELTSDFAINDADPESSIPSQELAMKKPLEMGYHLMLLSERADAATARGDHAAAAKYWRAMSKAVPDRSLPSSRACKSFEAAGDFENALLECRDALGKGGVTVEDNLRFVQLQLSKPGELSATDIADVEAVAEHLGQEVQGGTGEIQQQRVLCRLGSRLSDATRLSACTKRLKELAPSDSQTVVFSWSLAMLQRDFERAKTELDLAKKADVASAAINDMQAALRAATEQPVSVAQPSASAWAFRICVALLALLGLATLGLRLRRQVTRQES